MKPFKKKEPDSFLPAPKHRIERKRIHGQLVAVKVYDTPKIGEEAFEAMMAAKRAKRGR